MQYDPSVYRKVSVEPCSEPKPLNKELDKEPAPDMGPSTAFMDVMKSLGYNPENHKDIEDVKAEFDGPCCGCEGDPDKSLIGMVVRLNSGGPRMTIKRSILGCSEVECVWFDCLPNGSFELKHAFFHRECLRFD